MAGKKRRDAEGGKEQAGKELVEKNEREKFAGKNEQERSLWERIC
jgi:hypothetical protein